MVWRERFGKRVRDGMLGVLGVAALGVAAFFTFYEPPVRSIRLRMTAGQEGGTRHRIAQVLRGQAASRAITIELQAMAGSEKALEAVTSGQVDVALVQGGLDLADHHDLRQAAVLQIEPLHLLVKAEVYRAVATNLAGLRGKVVNVGERGSETYLLATEVMTFSGLRAGIDYTPTMRHYAELERETDLARLPDAVFSVSTLPSPIARHLVTVHRYRLISMPFRDSFALGVIDPEKRPADILGEKPTPIDRRHVYDTTIPASPEFRPR
jgi:TRAP-type uncharacterized transport system substrate-binding protein